MRQIKFRAWDDEKKVILKEIHRDFFKHVSIHPMQYTGLKDKNGKEIYEGDILKMDNWSPENVQVRFIQGAFCLAFLNGEYKDQFVADIHYIEHADKSRSEIIGNIYENPELLK